MSPPPRCLTSRRLRQRVRLCAAAVSTALHANVPAAQRPARNRRSQSQDRPMPSYCELVGSSAFWPAEFEHGTPVLWTAVQREPAPRARRRVAPDQCPVVRTAAGASGLRAGSRRNTYSRTRRLVASHAGQRETCDPMDRGRPRTTASTPATASSQWPPPRSCP